MDTALVKKREKITFQQFRNTSFLLKGKVKKSISRYIPMSDAMPIIGNINSVIVLTAVLRNTSLRSGLPRSDRYLDRNYGP